MSMLSLLPHTTIPACQYCYDGIYLRSSIGLLLTGGVGVCFSFFTMMNYIVDGCSLSVKTCNDITHGAQVRRHTTTRTAYIHYVQTPCSNTCGCSSDLYVLSVLSGPSGLERNVDCARSCFLSVHFCLSVSVCVHVIMLSAGMFARSTTAALHPSDDVRCYIVYSITATPSPVLSSRLLCILQWIRGSSSSIHVVVIAFVLRVGIPHCYTMCRSIYILTPSISFLSHRARYRRRCSRLPRSLPLKI